jgi:hypothetical protein
MTSLPRGGDRSANVAGDHSGIIATGDNPTIVVTAGTSDLGLTVRYERDEIAFGRENRYYLEINNRTSSPKRLTIKLEGVPDALIRFEPNNTATFVDEGAVARTLILQCAPTDLMAGSVPLRVVIKDEETGLVRLASEPITLRVPAWPSVDSQLLPPGHVFTAGTYGARLQLANTGNTAVYGTIRSAEVSDEEIDALDATRINLDESGFDLPWGGQQEILLHVDVPSPGVFDRKWAISLEFHIHNHGQGDVQSIRRYEFMQLGLWSIVQWQLAEAAQRVAVWGKQRRGVRQGWLAIGGVLLLVAGLLTGRATSATSSTTMPQAQAATASATTSIPMSSPVLPPSNGEPKYSVMPCVGGRSIVFLSAMKEQDVHDHGAWLQSFESQRLAYLAGSDPSLNGYAIQASQRDQVCPMAFKGKYRAAEDYVAFLWTGPVPSADAPGLCAKLQKGQYDCVPAATS